MHVKNKSYQFKPYAIINERMFKAESGNLHKEKPPK